MFCASWADLDIFQAGKLFPGLRSLISFHFKRKPSLLPSHKTQFKLIPSKKSIVNNRQTCPSFWNLGFTSLWDVHSSYAPACGESFAAPFVSRGFVSSDSWNVIAGSNRIQPTLSCCGKELKPSFTRLVSGRVRINSVSWPFHRPQNLTAASPIHWVHDPWTLFK